MSSSESDRDWAEWVAFHLERTGHHVRVEVRDRAPGHNRVHRLDEAVRSSRRTLVVLSPTYLADEALATEWHSAWEADPAGVRRKLVPVRVAECRPEGLLRDLRCIDLVGLDKRLAVARLLDGLDGTRSREGRPRLFPD
ncbi:toll/interleukin-1 receptor domain-containing protein [Lentzea sp. NPDC059081]|uniref:toll/interleukin-1 receptor domain-containing protein n=1 Tax=Lentzea sp. NPDC059081 TaxID=3346719 RepID=UPI0036B7768C